VFASNVLKNLCFLVLVAFAGSSAASAEPTPVSGRASVCLKMEREMRLACRRGRSACSKKTRAVNNCYRSSSSPAIQRTVPQACLMVFAPVCAKTVSGLFMVFPNGCEASRVGAVEDLPERCLK